MNSCPHAAYRGRRGWLPLVLAAGLLTAAWTAPLARADNVDDGLYKINEEIMNDLKSHGYKNVAVLKFQVQKDQAKPSMFVGRLNTLMATRLENVLILADDNDNPIGITRGASEAAASADPEANYRAAKDRQKLFQYDYPLAWGNKSVKVDAFLTGLVHVDPLTKKATVTVRAFDRNNAELRDVARCSVKIDRGLLADMNQPFVARRALKNRLEPDEEVVEEAVKDVFTAQGTPEQVAAIEKLLEFQLYYDGKPVVRQSGNRVPTPKDGQKVSVMLKAREKLGLVLRVNGRNTLAYVKSINDPKELERAALPRDPESGPMWVLEKDKEYYLEGFYVMDNKGKTKIMPFQVVAPNAVNRAEFGDEGKLGQIDLDIFGEGKKVVAKVDPPPSFRSEVVALASFQETKNKVLVDADSVRRRGVIVGASQRDTQAIDRVPFSGRCVARLTITYLERPGAPLGSK